MSNDRFAIHTLSFHQLRFNGGPANAPGTDIAFSASTRPVFRGGFSLMTNSFGRCLRGKCALCVYDSDVGRASHVQTVFRSQKSGVGFAPMRHAIRRNFISGALHLYVFASRRLFSHFRGCGLGDSGTHSNGITLSLGRLGRFAPNSCIIRASRNVKHFSKLIHVPGKSAARRILGLIFRGRSIIFISVRSLRGISGCGNGSNRTPHLGGLKAKT